MTETHPDETVKEIREAERYRKAEQQILEHRDASGALLQNPTTPLGRGIPSCVKTA
jgi:hypothetical protein